MTQDDILKFYKNFEQDIQLGPGQGIVEPNFKVLKNFSGVALVGENPGDYDVQAGEHFVGPYSQVLNETLLPSAGLNRDNVYLANVVKFNLPANRDPEPSEIAACGELTLSELEFVKPKLVVAMGKFAAEFFLEMSVKITKIHGTFYHYSQNNLTFDLLITTHPAAAYHNSYYINNIQSDFELIKKYLDNKEPINFLELPKTKSRSADFGERLF